MAKKAPRDIGVNQCPQCGQRSPVRLSSGQICASCRSEQAWSEKDRLTISRDDIEEAVERRSRGPKKPIMAIVLATAALSLSGYVGYATISLFRSEPLRGLDELMASMRADVNTSMFGGFLCLCLGIVALLVLRRSEHFHRRLLMVPHLLAVLVGAMGALIGGLHWLGLPGDDGMRHLTMPSIESVAPPSVHFERIARATAVLLAPDGEGDGRNASIGTAAIISTDDQHAWLVTCSHVAMPYAAVASWREPEDALPLWVQFYDGRSTEGRVVWAAPPPLDVAVLEVDIQNAPAPVDIALNTEHLDTGDPVLFVPLPYRDGWMVHHGEIEKRRSHNTPAGPYSLLYTTLPVQPGDSGSGLFDSQGMLIGLNTWSRFGNGDARGISLPAETLRTLAQAMREGRMNQLDEILPDHRNEP